MWNRFSRSLTQLVLLTAVAIGTASCTDAAETEVDCDAAAPAAEIVGAAASIDGVSLVLSGTASSPTGVAIRNIDLAGVAATNGGFNFESFSATLSEATWRHLVGADGTIAVPIRLRDACGAHDWTSNVSLPKAYQAASDAGTE